MTLLNVTKRSALSIAIGFFYPRGIITISRRGGEAAASTFVIAITTSARIFDTPLRWGWYCNKGAVLACMGRFIKLPARRRRRFSAGETFRLRQSHASTRLGVLPTWELSLGVSDQPSGHDRFHEIVPSTDLFLLTRDRDTYNRITLNASFFPPGWTR